MTEECQAALDTTKRLLSLEQARAQDDPSAWYGDRGPVGTARTIVQKSTVEGVDHPVRKIGSISDNIVEGIDHPGWKQVTRNGQMAANKNYRKIDSRPLGRQPAVGKRTCSSPSRGMMSHKTPSNLYSQHTRKATVRKAEHKWRALRWPPPTHQQTAGIEEVVKTRPQHLRDRAETINNRDTVLDAEDDIEINLDHDAQRNVEQEKWAQRVAEETEKDKKLESNSS